VEVDTSDDRAEEDPQREQVQVPWVLIAGQEDVDKVRELPLRGRLAAQRCVAEAVAEIVERSGPSEF